MKNAKCISIATAYLVALLGMAHPDMGWAESVVDSVKDWVEDGAETLKNEIDKLGGDFDSIQDYLDHYHWRGIIEDKAASGPALLKHLELNEHSRAVVVKPGEKIEAEVKCVLDAEQCSAFGLYRIVIGIKDEGPQTTIGNELGLSAGKTREKFTLTAPSKPGMYQIRFRPVDAFSKEKAFDAWKDKEGNEPDSRTTIGIIIVK